MSYAVQLFFGKSFTGKTARMLHELRAAPRVLLVDPKCGQLAKLKGYKHFWPRFNDETGNWEAKEGEGLINFLRRHRSGSPFKVAIHVRGFFRPNLEIVCLLAMALKDCVLAVDEMGLFVPPGPAGALPPRITSVAVSGTHDRVYLMGTAQRPSLVHGTIRANASRMLWYRLSERNDLEAARQYLPDDLAARVPSLPDYVCVDWTDGGEPFEDSSLVGKIHIAGSR